MPDTRFVFLALTSTKIEKIVEKKSGRRPIAGSIQLERMPCRSRRMKASGKVKMHVVRRVCAGVLVRMASLELGSDMMDCTLEVRFNRKLRRQGVAKALKILIESYAGCSLIRF